VATLKLLLARVGGGLGLTHEQDSFPLDSSEQKSSVVEEKHLYGCFSPRGSPCPSPQPVVLAASESKGMDGIIAPVLQITPELHELCGESSVVLLLEPSSCGDLAAAKTPLSPQSPAFVNSGVLARNSEALFAKELYGLLASLEAASPGYGKDIACVLEGKASEDIIKKVEKSLKKVSLRGKRRKGGVSRKASDVA
jgi:hypothetical protein